MDLDPSVTRRGPTQVVVAVSLCTTIGAACGYLLVTADWTDARKLLVGAALGAWCGLLLSTRRLMMM